VPNRIGTPYSILAHGKLSTIVILAVAASNPAIQPVIGVVAAGQQGDLLGRQRGGVSVRDLAQVFLDPPNAWTEA